MKHDGVNSRTRCGSRKKKKERTSTLSMLVTSPVRLLAWSPRGKGVQWMRVKEKTQALHVRDRRNEKGGDLGGQVLADDASDGGWRQW